MRNNNSLQEIAEINCLLSNIKKEYEQGIRPILLKNGSAIYTNSHKIPNLKKIQINRRLGLDAQNNTILKKNIEEFSIITGQKPVITKARNSVASFKIREGWPLGCKVTLRGNKMYEFMERLINIAIPRERDFRGLSPKSFDGQGNYNFGIKEQIIFPEIKFDNVDTIRGMDICINTSATNKEGAKALLEVLEFPFKK